MTPSEKYEALKARLQWWANGGDETTLEPLTDFGRGFEAGQQSLAEALLEFARGMEER